jgi:hypothetical protein
MIINSNSRPNGRSLTTVVYCLVSVLLLPAVAVADRINFTNGESITGVLTGAEEGEVKWASSVLGDLLVEQKDQKWSIGLNYDW